MTEGKHVLICGSDDLASATAIRLFRAGFQVVLLAADHPQDLHHQRTFSAAVYAGSREIDRVRADTAAGLIEKGEMEPKASLSDFIRYTLANRHIPIVFEDDLKHSPGISIDYIFSSDTALFDIIPERLSDDSVVIVPADIGSIEQAQYRICRDTLCLGSVIYPFNRDSFIDCKKDDPNLKESELVRTPLEGVFTTSCTLDDWIHEKQELGRINEIPILSPLSGKITGLMNSGLIIPGGTAFAEICPASKSVSAKRISAASYAIAGGVLEAVLFDINLKINK